MKRIYPDAAYALEGLLFGGMTIASGGFGVCGLTGKNVVDIVVRDLCVFPRPDHDSSFKRLELVPDGTANHVTANCEVAL